MACSTVLILKIIIIVIGFLAAVVGCVGIFDSDGYKAWDTASTLCHSAKTCHFSMWNYLPLKAGVFFTFAIISALILSIISLIIGLIVDCSASSLKGIDYTIHIIAGVLVICGSALLIDAMADYHLTTKYNERSMLRTESEIENEIKKEKKIIKYDEQMAAGVIGLLDGILYLVTALLIAM